MPEAARRNDLAGQRAFVKYWFDLYNYAYVTGDTAPVLAISVADTLGMKKMVEHVAAIHAGGGRQEGGGFELVDMVTVPLDDVDSAVPTIMIRQSAGEITHADGSKERIDPGQTEAYGMVLNWDGDHWSTYGIGTL